MSKLGFWCGGKKTMGIILLIIIIVIIIGVIAMYNGLIRLKNRVDEAWSDIDVQLKRRHDLIPNLVNTVKGYAAHEKEVFEKVTEARANAINAGTAQAKGQAENMLSGALKSLFAVAEAYPDLKANQNFLELQRELTDTEDKIMASRRFYNGNVRDFNTKIETFPTNIFAGMLNFTKRDFFQAEEGERENVKVEF
jgi:LemA protein